tara:strand:- start:469 stop:630 length:162 start_codon:yes stop_codon:yes gene_type:complete
MTRKFRDPDYPVSIKEFKQHILPSLDMAGITENEIEIYHYFFILGRNSVGVIG